MLKIYTRTTCAYCVAVKKLLDLKGAKYESINLDEHPEREQEAVTLSGVTSVPIITNGLDFVVGFQPSKILGLL